MIKGKKDYIKARRTTEFGFPGKPCCIDCLYFRKKTGLTKDMSSRYQFFTCQLTYEPLLDVTEKVGEFCPLDFFSESETEAENQDQQSPISG